MRLPPVMVVPRRRRRAGVTTRVDTFCAGTRRAGSPRGVVPVAPVATEQDSWNLALPRRATRGRFGGLGRGTIGSGWVYFSSRSPRNSNSEKTGFAPLVFDRFSHSHASLPCARGSTTLASHHLPPERALARHRREQAPLRSCSTRKLSLADARAPQRTPTREQQAASAVA